MSIVASVPWTGFVIMSFWPVWLWYAKRLSDGSDEPWGILALLAVAAIAALQGSRSKPSSTAIGCSACLVIAYAAAYSWLPFLVRGVLSVLALSFLLSSKYFGKTLQPGITGLLILSLPLIASLQFYGGFPIRFVTAHLCAWLINLIGYPVTVEGTLLHWFGEVIAVDAPCAGIKMLWSALFVNFCLAAWLDLGFFRTWTLTSFTMSAVFVGNVLRAFILFFIESGIVVAPDWAHSAIGVLVFSGVLIAILSLHSHLNLRSSRCEN